MTGTGPNRGGGRDTRLEERINVAFFNAPIFPAPWGKCTQIHTLLTSIVADGRRGKDIHNIRKNACLWSDVGIQRMWPTLWWDGIILYAYRLGR